PGNDPYAFVEFVDGTSAAAALAALNKRMVWGKINFTPGKTRPFNCSNVDERQVLKLYGKDFYET
ncbi:nucleolysin tia-1/tiar, partial [Plakobranchus ocellatus]